LTLLFALALSTLAAIVPTLVYTLTFYWADRYEREPRSLLFAAFIWGAVPAVIASLIGEVLLGAPLVSDPLSLEGAIVEGAIIAPVVEEVIKALALWWLFTWMRHEFDGVLDGLIYGALIGFGFAMTENFFYFIGAFDEGGFVNLTAVIILRSVVFGLNHAFYTSLTGIGFGFARSARSRAVRIVWIAAGLSAAILVHSLHNLGSTLASISLAGFALSLAIAGGGLCLLAITVLLSWSHERSVIRAELIDEIGHTLSAQELALLTGQWRQPLRRRSGRQANRMALYVELAVRKRALHHADEKRTAELHQEIAQIRKQLSLV